MALLPTALRCEFKEAIRALEFGEVRPLLEPAKGQHEKAYTQWRLRLCAIENAYFLWGWGEAKTKQDAFRKVAHEFGRSYDTIVSWDRGPDGLVRYFGAAFVKVAQKTAKRSGEQLRRLQMQLHTSDLDKEMGEVLLRIYGPKALSANAQRFKIANRGHTE